MKDDFVDKASFEKKLRELAGEFGASDKQYLSLLKAINDADVRVEKDYDCVESSLDFLRVCIKYMRFDLESTRRENRYLRKLLEEQEE